MIRIFKISFTFFLTFLLISACGIFEAQSKRKPKWVTNRPVDNTYYIGIAKASKSEANYFEIAKNKALADMISEISVQISSQSILNQVEDDNGLQETYKAKIELSTKNFIEGYELVDSWEDKKEYWVYYRLSKQEYKRKKQEIINRAINLSKDFYEKAKTAEKEFDINNALIYYIKSFDAIKNYIGEDLSAFTTNGKVHMDNAIYQSIQDILSRIIISPEKEVYTIKSLSSENEPVNVKVKLKTDLETQNLATVPIVFSYQKQHISGKEEVLTNNKGVAECTKVSMLPKGKDQIIKAEFNINSYFEESADDNILKNMVLQNTIHPYSNINIEVKELIAYLDSREFIFGNQHALQPISQIVKEELSKSFFSFINSEEKADLMIKIDSKIIKGTKLDKHNLHTVFLNCNLSVTDVNNKIVIFNDVINIKGMASGSFESAAKDAIKKAKSDINTKLIPNIRTIKL